MGKYKGVYDVVIILFILISGTFLFLENYVFTHISFSILLLVVLVTRESLNTKIFVGYLFLYYLIPFLNISTYRGIISFETLRLYTFANFALLAPLLFTFGNKFFVKKEVIYQKLKITPLFINTVLAHLSIVYLLLLYTLVTVGNVLLHQELRFFMSPTISYLIKSTLYIPIFVVFFEYSQFTRKNILFFVILPLFPAFFIGSRGTVIMIVICVGLLYLLKSFKPGSKYYLNNSEIWKKYKYKLYLSGGITLFLFQFIYYSRRWFSDTFITNTELATKYFGSVNWFYLLIMPVYFSLRETVGITERIVRDKVTNIWFEYPMFFSEVMTLLPGEQAAPGDVLSRHLYATDYPGGITPGVIGALYIDYRYWLVPILFLISFLIYYLYKKSTSSDMYKILYVITLAQFFHLYHRGFFKPEYLVAYGIILFYVFISSVKLKQTESVNL